jgi:hypothetical protein
MKFFAIPNLRSDETAQIDPFTFVPDVPEAAKKTKSAFKLWSADGLTKHAFVSMVEGLNPHQRVTDENPPAIIHGILIDYDAPAGDDPIGFVKKRGGDPTIIHTSYSGHIRLGWTFAEPIPVTADIAHKFIQQIHKAISASKIFPGYDQTSAKPNQYLEIGSGWKMIGPTLSVSQVQTCLFKAYSEKGYTASDIEIPIELVAAEVERRFPGKWTGRFELESRGPLFWIDDGIAREGAQVKPDGMLCFSDRAGKGFLTWREILGSKFVSEYEVKRVGESLTDFHFDGTNYWRTTSGYGLKEAQETVVLGLRKLGFSTKAKKGAPLSEVEEALYHIQSANRVDGAAPCLFDSRKVAVLADGRKIVNLSRPRAIAPAAEGDPSTWPWLWSYLNGLIDREAVCEDGLDPYLYFWAWCARTYRACFERLPLSGQAIILAGETGRGKTLFGRGVMGTLCGGWAEAGPYLLGATSFNKEISEQPIWTVDDNVSSVDFKEQRRFTELLKKAVANPTVDSHHKGRDSQLVPWTGRVILGVNLDSNSLAAIPNLDQSNRDKLSAYQTPVGNKGMMTFPSNAEVQAILVRELPHFGKWLLDYTPDPRVLGDSRYGVRSYFHPNIERAARDNSPRQQILEVIEMFIKELLASDPKRVEWTGSSAQLMGEMSEMPLLRIFGSSRNSISFQRDLASAEEYSTSHPEVRKIRSRSTGSGKIWTINLQPVEESEYS